MRFAVLLGGGHVEVGAALGNELETVLGLGAENLMAPTDEELK